MGGKAGTYPAANSDERSAYPNKADFNFYAESEPKSAEVTNVPPKGKTLFVISFKTKGAAIYPGVPKVPPTMSSKTLLSSGVIEVLKDEVIKESTAKRPPHSPLSGTS